MALDYEIARQVAVIESGGTSGAGDAAVQRRDRRDGRHAQQGTRARLPLFPRARSGSAARERGLAASASRQTLPELPADKRARFIESYGLREYDAQVLTQTRELERIFRDARPRCRAIGKTAANWVMGDLTGRAKGTATLPSRP